ncbi:hypothetical protein PBCV1_A014R [Paramecium bursaria Chlorella virus 1]|uniref:Chlorovirus glycoprotein repeat domain-containing protein n=1 Tax=Paramecium bursaria Chlorella virus 1 TaxID=10506 RepID=Q89349_PBCV1|nr:hypothetical protein PBCV1_A014R [Paramecium bursaria Chlorella virus 1]8H2I_cP Chain cP, P21 [Paramecium bursaria Chlorella virus 1]8H2I_db Chain db, P21 [Paramecium bursaria Chlorella virus 1]8H2I_dh Chain dh, P21 [Paramecium bursaria Chlorella virus 1]8H2I_dt Chain dt, P21 [Paramecium bursaria Chlorella virus 1]AAC96382.1 hypothetical protein [Paramecium bursaria Chlorella virus 1]
MSWFDPNWNPFFNRSIIVSGNLVVAGGVIEGNGGGLTNSAFSNPDTIRTDLTGNVTSNGTVRSSLIQTNSIVASGDAYANVWNGNAAFITGISANTTLVGNVRISISGNLTGNFAVSTTTVSNTMTANVLIGTTLTVNNLSATRANVQVLTGNVTGNVRLIANVVNVAAYTVGNLTTSSNVSTTNLNVTSNINGNVRSSTANVQGRLSATTPTTGSIISSSFIANSFTSSGNVQIGDFFGNVRASVGTFDMIASNVFSNVANIIEIRSDIISNIANVGNGTFVFVNASNITTTNITGNITSNVASFSNVDSIFGNVGNLRANTLTVTYANITGTLASGNVAVGNLISADNTSEFANITSFTTNGLVVNGNIIAAIGNGNVFLANVITANSLTLQSSSSTAASNVTTTRWIQSTTSTSNVMTIGNITSGNVISSNAAYFANVISNTITVMSAMTVSGNVSFGNVSFGNVSYGNITANVTTSTGNVSVDNLTSNVVNVVFCNASSVTANTLTSIALTGNTYVYSANTGVLTANVGNVFGTLTVGVANVTSMVSNALFANTAVVSNLSVSNLTVTISSDISNISITGNTSGNVFAANIATIGTLNTANVVANLVASNVMNAWVTSNIRTLITGNANVSTTTSNVITTGGFTITGNITSGLLTSNVIAGNITMYNTSNTTLFTSNTSNIANFFAGNMTAVNTIVSNLEIQGNSVVITQTTPFKVTSVLLANVLFANTIISNTFTTTANVVGNISTDIANIGIANVNFLNTTDFAVNTANIVNYTPTSNINVTGNLTLGNANIVNFYATSANIVGNITANNAVITFLTTPFYKGSGTVSAGFTSIISANALSNVIVFGNLSANIVVSNTLLSNSINVATVFSNVVNIGQVTSTGTTLVNSINFNISNVDVSGNVLVTRDVYTTNISVTTANIANVTFFSNVAIGNLISTRNLTAANLISSSDLFNSGPYTSSQNVTIDTLNFTAGNLGTVAARTTITTPTLFATDVNFTQDALVAGELITQNFYGNITSANIGSRITIGNANVTQTNITGNVVIPRTSNAAGFNSRLLISNNTTVTSNIVANSLISTGNIITNLLQTTGQVSFASLAVEYIDVANLAVRNVVTIGGNLTVSNVANLFSITANTVNMSTVTTNTLSANTITGTSNVLVAGNIIGNCFGNVLVNRGVVTGNVFADTITVPLNAVGVLTGNALIVPNTALHSVAITGSSAFTSNIRTLNTPNAFIWNTSVPSSGLLDARRLRFSQYITSNRIVEMRYFYITNALPQKYDSGGLNARYDLSFGTTLPTSQGQTWHHFLNTLYIGAQYNTNFSINCLIINATTTGLEVIIYNPFGIAASLSSSTPELYFYITSIATSTQ